MKTSPDNTPTAVDVPDLARGAVWSRWKRMGALGIAALIGAGAMWAGGYLLRPAGEQIPSRDHVLVEVTEGRIGASLTLTTLARWGSTHSADNNATGVVTSVPATGARQVQQGDTLYTVDLRPVVVARGTVPAFRNIEAGMKGDDVAQVQQMLRDLGLLSGPVDGRASPRTVAAVRAWQRRLGVEQTGTVPVGDVLFLPEVPSRVSLDPDRIAVGRRLSGGEAVVSILKPAPSFDLPVTASQASLIKEGTVVLISVPDGGQWRGIAGAAQPTESADVFRIPLSGESEAPLCGLACTSVPVAGETRLSSTVVTVPEQSGLVVPTGALVTGPGGEPAVMDAQGTILPVTVVASAQGMSLVEGVPAGTRVRLQQR